MDAAILKFWTDSFFSNDILPLREKMATDFDFLGFTRQTETLLRGVGAHDLIQEFKRRNISTDTLHKLTKEDFIQLGNTLILTTAFLSTHSVYRDFNFCD